MTAIAPAYYSYKFNHFVLGYLLDVLCDTFLVHFMLYNEGCAKCWAWNPGCAKLNTFRKTDSKCLSADFIDWEKPTIQGLELMCEQILNFNEVNTTQGRFHVKGLRKKVNVEKWILFDEIWKIIRQIYDFGRFLNIFCNYGVFFCQKSNIPKNAYF